LKTLLRPGDPLLGASSLIFDAYLCKQDLEVWVVRDRRTRSGDFRFSRDPRIKHRITVNAGLKQQHFLIILAHEVAHYIAYLRYRKGDFQPHGIEWKTEFRELLRLMLGAGCFSNELAPQIARHMRKPTASLSSDARLWQTLNHDNIPQGYIMLKEIPLNACFELSDGRRFEKLERRRTRFTCRELSSGKLYWVSGLATAKLLAS
jgi:SprT protein